MDNDHAVPWSPSPLTSPSRRAPWVVRVASLATGLTGLALAGGWCTVLVFFRSIHDNHLAELIGFAAAGCLAAALALVAGAGVWFGRLWALALGVGAVLLGLVTTGTFLALLYGGLMFLYLLGSMFGLGPLMGPPERAVWEMASFWALRPCVGVVPLALVTLVLLVCATPAMFRLDRARHTSTDAR